MCGTTLPRIPQWFNSVWPVATFVLGLAAAFGRDLISQSRQDRRELTARQHETEKAARERREAFELEHLVEFNSLLRASVESFFDFEAAMRPYRAAQAAGQPLTEVGGAAASAGSSFQASHAALAAQIGFIVSDEVREKAKAAASDLNEAYDHELFADHDSPTSSLSREALDAAYEVLSARVREIYAGRDQG